MQKFYRAFEEKFRGSKKKVKEKVSIYLDLIKDFKNKKILDLGCGRGEFLELLKENHFHNLFGVDINEEMTKEIDKEINIYNQDVISFLKSQKESSFSVISSFHLIEHLDFNALFELVKESYKILDENGILILETPNPENIKVACENFYLDPTHKHPLPPELLKFLLEYFGFHSRILRLNNPPINNTIKDVIEHVSPDYAVVGFKNSKMINEDFFNKGVHLDLVESAFENRIKNLEERMKNLEIEKLIAENFHLKNLNKHINYQKDQLEKHIELIESENSKLKEHIEYMNKEQKRIIQENENEKKQLKKHIEYMNKEQKRIIQENENEKKQLKKQNQKLNSQINELNSQINILNNHIKVIEEENKNIKNHSQYIENLYYEVISSKSWKITKPLRDFTNFFREKKREKIIQIVNKEENPTIELSPRSKEIYEMLKKEIKGKK